MISPTRSDSGFSRLDLLAAAAATTILASLALPLVAGNVTHSRSAICMDHSRRLSLALGMYALENEWYPPNPDDGNATPGRNWVAGQAGVGGPHEFASDILEAPSTSLLVPYLGSVGRVFSCPEDPRVGRYQGVREEMKAKYVQSVRSVSMNGAVGTDPYATVKQPVSGPWLDNQHGHLYGQTWRTFGRPSQVVGPNPSGLAVFLDEDPYSLNDGHFGVGMAAPEWIDWPATHHDTAGTLAFADGHVELHRWLDPRTVVNGGRVARLTVPGSVDMTWLQERTSARLAR